MECESADDPINTSAKARLLPGDPEAQALRRSGNSGHAFPAEVDRDDS